MLYFNEIDIPEWQSIVSDVSALYNTQRYSAAENLFNPVNVNRLYELSPRLREWVESQGLVVKNAAVVFCAGQKTDYSPHIDSDVGCLAVNIPIYNCSDTWTSFYKVKEGTTRQVIQRNSIIYYTFSEDAIFEEVARYTLDRPLIINTKVAHAVFNPTEDVRLALTLRFVNDPWHLITGLGKE